LEQKSTNWFDSVNGIIPNDASYEELTTDELSGFMEQYFKDKACEIISKKVKSR
jgi:hypothetical protein